MVTLSVRPESGRKTINPRMWGVFYEEINHAGDGGLYAELVRNRAFADGLPPEGTAYFGGKATTPSGFQVEAPQVGGLPGWEGWHTCGARAMMQLCHEGARNPRVPCYLGWDIAALPTGADCAVVNRGYWGMAVQAERRYRYRIIARCAQGYRGCLGVALLHASGARLAQAETEPLSPAWTCYSGALVCQRGDAQARLALLAQDTGRVEVDYVSLIPEDAVCGVFRPDLLEMLKALRPGFLRFPGGCVVEGVTLQNAFDWKRTIGPEEDRPGRWMLWGYRSPEGLGLHEYLLLCEQLGASAMYVFNCGMTCQARKSVTADPDAWDDYLRSAIDAVEYAIGPISTPYGAMRAAAGHPAPFDLKYLEIGNENHGEDYERLYAHCYAALADRFPQLTLIATDRVASAPIQMLDEHFYTQPGFFPTQVRRYDRYDRRGPKIYVGEYACNQQVGEGNLAGALSEAAFMIGLENNCDVVQMASYAPLLMHVRDRRWPVNLIGFDGSGTYAIPSYDVQRLFADNRPDTVVDCRIEGLPPLAQLYATAGERGDELLLKVVNFSPEPVQVELDAPGAYRSGQVLCGDPEDTNDLARPHRVAPVPAPPPVGKTYSFAPYSLTMLRFG